ncbi:MAG: insulinase family protein [Rhodospirillaceae bacterium]|nr:insulinase family protein [Rhodospirillaceae bacterium]
MTKRPKAPVAPAARLLAAFLLLAPALFATGPAGAAIWNPKTFTLDNGLQVVVVENDRVPAVTQMIFYRVGAADEAPGKSGLAHYLEHLMFKGTDRFPNGEFSRLVALNGGRENAFTSQDYTGYFQSVAKDRLELILELEADRMTNLVLTDAVARPELDVVIEERRSRIDNNPAALLDERTGAVLYLHHPYGIPITGWMDEIEGLTTEDARAFYRRHYAPDNAVLVITGDVTVDEVRPLVEKYYGAIPARGIAPRQRVREPEPLTERRVEMASPLVRQSEWSRSYLAPNYSAGESGHAYALQVLAQVLGGGATSRLYRRLVVERKLASSAGAYYQPDAIDLSRFSLYASPRDGVSVEEVERAIDEEIAAVLAEGVDPEAVARANARLEAAAVYARDGLQAGARSLGVAVAAGRDIADVEAWPDRIAAVTVGEVDAAARHVLRPKRSVTAVLTPEEPAL